MVKILRCKACSGKQEEERADRGKQTDERIQYKGFKIYHLTLDNADKPELVPPNAYTKEMNSGMRTAAAKDGVMDWRGNGGRIVNSTPAWREWAAGFVPTSVGALAAGGFIGWNDVRMYVARTFDAPIVEMPLPGRIREFVEGVEAPGVLWFMEGNHARRFALR